MRKYMCKCAGQHLAPSDLCLGHPVSWTDPNVLACHQVHWRVLVPSPLYNAGILGYSVSQTENGQFNYSHTLVLSCFETRHIGYLTHFDGKILPGYLSFVWSSSRLPEPVTSVPLHYSSGEELVWCLLHLPEPIPDKY